MTREPEQIFLLNHSESSLNVDLRRNCPANAQDNLENVKDFSNVCRTCAAVTEFIVPIFEGEGLQNKLADKIHQHLPIKVSEQDSLPRVVCYQCASTLLAWHELVKCCLQADEALKTKQAVWAAEASVQEKPGISDDVPIKDLDEPASQDEYIQECKTMKEIMKLVESFFYNQRDLKDLTFACHKCESNVLYGPALLTDHLHKHHSSDMITSGSVKRFVDNNISIVEILESEGEEPEVAVDAIPQTIDAHFDENEIVEDASTIELTSPTKKVIKSTNKLMKKVKVSKVRETEYPCPYCECVFTSCTRLVCHTSQHQQVTINKNLICNVCVLEFATKKDFVDHLRKKHSGAATHSGPSKLLVKCKGCGFVAQSPQLLQVHIKEKHDTYKLKKPQTKHLEHSPGQVQCELCKNLFSDKCNLKAHMLRQHGTGAKEWQCSRCDKAYRSKQMLRMHESVTHEGQLRFVCATCGERFPLRSAMQVHARKHTGELPYRCALCGAAFRSGNSLSRHRDTHAGVRNYACAHCSKRFRNTSHLKRHVAAMHNKQPNLKRVRQPKCSKGKPLKNERNV